jgi:hypothetical protein
VAGLEVRKFPEIYQNINEDVKIPRFRFTGTGIPPSGAGGYNPQHSKIRKSRSQFGLRLYQKSVPNFCHENCLIHMPQMSGVDRSIFSSKFFNSVPESA